jgi:hypothetical protein
MLLFSIQSDLNDFMKLIKTLLLLTCLFWLAPEVFGAQVDSQKAATVVEGWLQLDRAPFGEPLGDQVKSVETFKDSTGTPLYHVVYLRPSGFVIVPAEDGVEPIIAFARQGHFDPSLKNPLGALVSKDVPARVARARALGSTPAGLKSRTKWQKLQQSAAGGPEPAGIGTGAISDLRIAPFIQTLWSQSTYNDTTNGEACYNFFTPPHEAGNPQNYVCGCVATAMAQLMYYNRYPSVGVGTPSFVISVDGVEMSKNLRGGDGKGGPYQWSNMPLAPINIPGGPSTAQCAAIGALTYDAGVAVHMQYTLDESAAYMTDCQEALASTFKYNNVIIAGGDTNNLNVGADLLGMINPNLDARLPVLFGISGTPGGHAIVCDGYGYNYSTLYHHVNMGWSGAYNAWYALPIIDLETTNGYVYFTSIDSCVYNIFTNGTGEIISGRVLDNNTGLPITGASVTAIRIGGGTYAASTDANGIYAFAGVPSASTYVVTVTNTGYFPASSNFSTSVSYDSSTGSGNVWGADFSLIPASGPPVITVQPQDQIVDPGATATFAVVATGALPLTYQWQSCASGSTTWTNLIDGGNISGSGTATLTVNQVSSMLNGQPFRCIITNSLGSVTSSPPAVLFVNIPSYLTITTLAGLAGNGGTNDGTGSGAQFNNPRGIAVDNHTNVYVTDLNSDTVRKLTLAGTNWVVSTIAGLAGVPGSADGTNSDARFNGPYGIAADSSGNVYVADAGNNTIRMLTPAGANWVVSTIAGLAGSSGSADGANSNIRFHYPIGLAADSSGNVYVADEANNTIRKLTPSGTNWVSSTLAGQPGSSGSADGTNSNARFNNPYGVAVDSGGNLYVADKYSCTIRKITPSGANWVVSTLAGLAYNTGTADGISSAARFNNPTGIAVDSGGNIYVADDGNNTIRQIVLMGTSWQVFTVAGMAGNPGSTDGIGSAALFNGPYGIAVDQSTNVFVADAGNDTIRGTPLDPAPTPTTIKSANLQTGSTFTFTWSAMVSHTYQVQYKTNLTQTTWNVLTNVVAPNWTGIAAVPIGTDPQRFYRVVLLP